VSFAPAIDAHVHLFPERLFAAIRDALEADLGWDCRHHPDRPAGIEATLRGAGVERFLALPYAHEPGVAERLNEWLLQAADRSTMAVPFATVHGDDDVRRVVQQAFNRGARGLKFQCPVQGSAPNDPRLDPAFELAAEYDRPIIFHAGTAPNFADSPHVGYRAFSEFVDSYPEVRVCCAHMGARDTDSFLALARAEDQVFLDTSVAMSAAASDLLDHDPASVPDDVFEDLAGSVMYGSDYPNVPYAYDREREHLLGRDLSEAAERALFHDAAERFLGERTD
jgi:predicted TIM-barrel fold metal-dependent hydrolase